MLAKVRPILMKTLRQELQNDDNEFSVPEVYERVIDSSLLKILENAVHQRMLELAKFQNQREHRELELAKEQIKRVWTNILSQKQDPEVSVSEMIISFKDSFSNLEIKKVLTYRVVREVLEMELNKGKENTSDQRKINVILSALVSLFFHVLVKTQRY